MSESETNRGESRSWLSWLTLLVLLGVALALRWRYIREISLFVDEFVTAWAARNVLNRGLPVFPSGNLYPHGFLFTYLVAPFVAGEFNETLVRLPGLLIGLAGLPAAYWVGRKLLSRKVGLIAAAAMAVDPACIIWGGRARMYGLLQLLSLLAVYFYYRGLADDRPRDRILAMGLLVAAVFTHAEAAFLLPVLGLATLLVLPWRRVLRWSVILPFAVGAAGAAAFYLLAKYGQPGHLVIMQQENRSYLDLTSGFRSGPQAFAPFFLDLHRLPFTLLALAGLPVLVHPRFDRRSPLAYLYLVFGAFSLLIIFGAGAFWQRERYLFLVLPLLFLISGEALTWLLKLIPALRQRSFALFVPFVVIVWIGLTGAPDAYVQEWGYDLAFRFLRDQDLPAGDRIVTSMSTAAHLYLGRDDAFAIQRGYEEYVVAPPEIGQPVDLWTATPVLTRTAEFVDLLTASPRLWFVTDGWRFQTRYEPDFIQTVLEQMDLVYDERGVLLFRGEGYAPPPVPAVQRQRQADFGAALRLTGLGLSAARPKSGDELEITLHWQALDQVGPEYTVFLHLIAPDGAVGGVAGLDEPLLGGLYQPTLWPTGATVSDPHRLSLPPDIPPGRYRLDLGLYPSGQPDQLLPVEGWDRLPLAALTVGDVATPPPAMPTDVTFGDAIRLLGYDLDPVTGRESRITLHWQAAAPMSRNYTVFVHALDAQGNIVAQDDGPPGDPFFPTITWLPGDVVLDARLLTWPAGTPAGEYTLLVGLYYQPSAERLPAVDAAGDALGDALPLTTIVVGPESP